MRIKRISYFMLTLLVLTNVAMANQNQSADSLQGEREKVVSQYIMDLKNADYQHITELFEKNGTVISTSKGNVNAKDFFYAFLPEIVSANTELHQSFTSSLDRNHYAVRFHFTFILKDGEKGDGEYVDEFIFTDHSEKLSAVYMFENIKFKNVNN